jgi:hypothetical protein
MQKPIRIWQLYGQSETPFACYLREAQDGYEIEVIRDGAACFAERYPTRDEAGRHAEEYRASLLRKGWHQAA